jgi:hypothetical protein
MGSPPAPYNFGEGISQTATGGSAMVDLREVPNTNILELVIDGAISAEEFDVILARFTEAIGRHGKIRVLEEVRSLGGIPPSKWWQDLKFGFQHMRDIERAAVVSDAKWIEIFANLLNPFFSAEIRYFKPDEVAAARAWLLESPTG